MMGDSIPDDLEKYRVTSLPSTVYYIPNFIDGDQEEDLIRRVYDAPKPKWRDLKNRRLQNWGGVPHKDRALLASEEIPIWLKIVIDRVMERTKLFENERRPNHVLVNEYLPGQGIMAHTDGPLYHPIVANITLGSHGVLEIRENNESRKLVGEILLEQKSLLITKDELYSSYLHGIAEKTADVVEKERMKNLDLCSITEGTMDRGTRVSLTIRNIPKVIVVKV